MKTITANEMLDYIFSQPPEKPVDWLENEPGAKCGCLMFQFAKDMGLGELHCGFRTWYLPNSEKLVAQFEIGLTYENFRPNTYGKSINTYKELQEHCKKEFYNYVVKS